LNAQQAIELQRTHTVVARLINQGARQDQLERVLQQIYRDGNDALRSALIETNDALAALGYSRVSYTDALAD
jgi:hypothetical protein